MADVEKRARHLHEVAAGMDPRAQRAWPTGPIGDAMHAGSVRFNVLNHPDHHGTDGPLILRDSRDLAGMITGAAKAGQVTGKPETFETIMALAYAAWVSSTRAEQLDVAHGDDAA